MTRWGDFTKVLCFSWCDVHALERGDFQKIHSSSEFLIMHLSRFVNHFTQLTGNTAYACLSNSLSSMGASPFATKNKQNQTLRCLNQYTSHMGDGICWKYKSPHSILWLTVAMHYCDATCKKACRLSAAHVVHKTFSHWQRHESADWLKFTDPTRQPLRNVCMGERQY